jgi:hypothetical protein
MYDGSVTRRTFGAMALALASPSCALVLATDYAVPDAGGPDGGFADVGEGGAAADVFGIDGPPDDARRPCPGVFCDPFDQPTDFDPFVAFGDGVSSIDTVAARQGAASARIHHPFTSAGVDFVGLGRQDPVVFASPWHLRAFVRMSNPAGEFFAIAEADSQAAFHLYIGTGGAVFVGSYANQGQLAASLDVQTAFVPAPGRWFCVQVELVPAVNGHFQVTLDGTVTAELAISRFDTRLDYLKIENGYATGPESDVWYDDLAYGPAPIACQ